jgi:hypothetical protein
MAIAKMQVHDMFSEITGVCKLNRFVPDVHYSILKCLIKNKQVSGKADLTTLYATQEAWMDWLFSEPDFSKEEIKQFYDIIHAITFQDYTPLRVQKYEEESDSDSEEEEEPEEEAPAAEVDSDSEEEEPAPAEEPGIEKPPVETNRRSVTVTVDGICCVTVTYTRNSKIHIEVN